MTGLAGLCAEAMTLGRANEIGASVDIERIECLRRHNRFSDGDILDMADDVRRLLRTHRDELERIATALDRHETLDGADIDALVTGKACRPGRSATAPSRGPTASAD